MNKSTYSKKFKSFAQKLWFWRTNWDLFLGHPVYQVSQNRDYKKAKIHSSNFTTKQGKRDVWKIHMTLQILRLAPLRVVFSKKQKARFHIWSRRVCVLNIRSVSFFVVANRRRTNLQTKPTYLQVTIGTYSTGWKKVSYKFW